MRDAGSSGDLSRREPESHGSGYGLIVFRFRFARAPATPLYFPQRVRAKSIAHAFLAVGLRLRDVAE